MPIRRLKKAAKIVDAAMNDLIRPALSWREGSVEERLSHALVHGIDAFIEEDAEEGAVRRVVLDEAA